MPALARLRARQHCGRPACHLAAEQQSAHERRAQHEQAARRAIARQLGAAAGEAGAVVWLEPHGATATVATTSAEREGIAAHLLACANGLSPRPRVEPDPRWAEPDGDVAEPGRDATPTPENASLPSQAGALCAGCGGRCCRIGLASHAFIDTRLLERWAARRPGSGLGHAVQAYLERVPRHHVQGSCLFHTGQGCALPREDRSAVCNNFECRGLVEAKRALAREPGTALAALVGVNGRVERGFWIGPDGQRHALRTRR